MKVGAVANQRLTCSEVKSAAQDAYFPALIASWIRILPSYWLHAVSMAVNMVARFQSASNPAEKQASFAASLIDI